MNPDPDPIRPPETDEEPWSHPRLGVVGVAGDDDFASTGFSILLVVALAVIVGISIAWALR